jgi:hypothetical protein
MSDHRQNLDRLAAARSQELVKVIGKPVKGDRSVKATEADNLYTKALGVLQEHGLYATALYLLYRSGSQTGDDTTKYSAEELVATKTMTNLWAMLSEDALAELQVRPEHTIDWTALNDRDQKEAVLTHFSENLCGSDLGRMLFIKELFVQTLIYARYHARALRE